MNTGPIAAALRNSAAKVRLVNVTTEAEDQTLRDAADLLRVLASLMEGALPIKAFGPPGDWGYDTEIGKAVLALRDGTCAAAPQYQPRRTPVGAGDGNTFAVG